MRVLILGYGDVGKTVAKVLVSRNAEVVVVDIADISPSENVEFIRADVTLEEFWENFDLSGFDAAVVALPHDLHAIFCVLMMKNKRPDLKIYARCNSSEYVEKLYRAGADHVINLPVVTAEMILSEVFGEEIRRRLTFENIEVKVYVVERGSKLSGLKLSDIQKAGVLPLAAECDGKIFIDDSFVLGEGCKVAVAGKRDELVKFEVEFVIPDHL